jgi:serine/threonine protein kinase
MKQINLLHYSAPELVLGRGHGKAVDYWAFGILLYEMAAGYSPFADQNGMDQVVICRNIVNGKLVFPKDFNADCKDVIKKLLVREEAKRLGNQMGGADEIQTQKWFKSIDFPKLLKKEIKAPWIPALKGITDTSNFDPYATDEHVDDGSYRDNSGWDKDF